jgi:hypothetical protein
MTGLMAEEQFGGVMIPTGTRVRLNTIQHIAMIVVGDNDTVFTV